MHDGPGRWRRVAAAAGALAILTGTLVAPGGAAAADRTPAPLLAATGPAVPGSYIVVLKGKPGSGTAARSGAAVSRAAALGVTVERRYSSALNGFSAKLTAKQISALRLDPDVAYISPNHKIGTDIIQGAAPWGLDRVDQRTRALDTIYDYNRTGIGVTVYVIDTGIRATHTEFGNRVISGYDAYWEDEVESTDDCEGHGTHVAGTIGSYAYGVAKDVRLVPVKVFGCSPWTSTDIVISGVDWVTYSHASIHYGAGVANMSLGGPADAALDYAVSNSIASGITYVVAAGNNITDACNISPARVPAAITVGAVDNTDTRAYFSNYGACVDIFAPGVDILSAGIGSDWDSGLKSGTSMASPHVAGAAAFYIEERNWGWSTPDVVAQWLIDNSTPGVLSNIYDSPNRLLYIHEPAGHVGTTWLLKEYRHPNKVLVGSDSGTDPVYGDHGHASTLPMLCLLNTGSPPPSGITMDRYHGWAKGWVALTPPITGTQLVSFSEAGRICAATFGANWRMAEFHDGYYNGLGIGWNYWAYGDIPANTRFWVAVNDQKSNVWSY